MSASISQRQFAALCGVSPTLIAKLIRKGQIPCNADRSIPRAAGLAAMAARHPERPVAPRAPAAPDPPPSAPDPAEHAPDALPSPHAKLAMDVRRADLLKKSWDARLREMEFRRLSGDLVLRAEVEADAREAAELIRAGFLALPQRVALQLEGPSGPRAPVIEALVAEEVNRILTVLHQTRFGPPAVDVIPVNGREVAPAAVERHHQQGQQGEGSAHAGSLP